jgi:hypothetical protein
MDVAKVEVPALSNFLQLILGKVPKLRLNGTQVVVNAETTSRIVRGKHFDGTGRTHDEGLWRCEEIPKGCGELYQSGTVQSIAVCVI